MYAIETEDLTKSYGGHLWRRKAPSLDSLNLTVHPNEVFGFLGLNGAGKTTAIKILCGLLRPTRGRAKVAGIDVSKRISRRKIGYLPENPYFYEYLTPKETLDFYGRLKGLSRAERHGEWDMLSELLNLRGIAEQRIREFSKGMRQRLGFAVALVGDPDVLILDEPMSGLDPLGRRNIRELILMMRKRGKTIFFSSHVLSDVEQICDRAGILVEGRLSVVGKISELLEGEVRRVEVIAADLGETEVASIKDDVIGTRTSEEGTHFVVGSLEEANAIVKRISDAGGRILEFTPVKESLEDYFMREQERTTSPGREAAGSPSVSREVGERTGP